MLTKHTLTNTQINMRVVIKTSFHTNNKKKKKTSAKENLYIANRLIIFAYKNYKYEKSVYVCVVFVCYDISCIV